DAARVHRDEPALPDPEGAPSYYLEISFVDFQVGVLLDEHDLSSPRGMLGRRAPARVASADHEDHRVPVLGVEAARSLCVRVDAAEARDPPEELLVEGPGSTRPDHRTVVEADRGERTPHLVRDRQQVVLERAPDVLGSDRGSVADRLGADAHVGYAV